MFLLAVVFIGLLLLVLDCRAFVLLCYDVEFVYCLYVTSSIGALFSLLFLDIIKFISIAGFVGWPLIDLVGGF